MASYNELLALIDAYINQNGVQAITGQVLNGVLRAMVDQLGRGYSIMGAADPTTDPGTPDGPETWFASVPGTYTNFDGIQIVDGELALLSYEPSTGFSKNTIYEGFQTVQATIDGNVGTPAVGVSYANGILSFDFHNMKGVTGDPAGFGAVTASVDSNIGTPSVQVQTSGPDTAKAIAFQFHNLKGETGVTSVLATVDNTSGNPQCAVSLNGQQLVLNFTGLKGAQGDTGSSVDYPFTIVNNLTTNDATQALSAAMGVQLESEVSQLEAEMDWLDSAFNLDTFVLVSDQRATLYQDRYVRFSDGVLVTAGVQSRMRAYSIPNNGYNAVRAIAQAGDTVPAIISFYSGTGITSANYLGGVQSIVGVKDYSAPVPSGTKIIVVTTKYTLVEEPKLYTYKVADPTENAQIAKRESPAQSTSVNERVDLSSYKDGEKFLVKINSLGGESQATLSYVNLTGTTFNLLNVQAGDEFYIEKTKSLYQLWFYKAGSEGNVFNYEVFLVKDNTFPVYFNLYSGYQLSENKEVVLHGARQGVFSLGDYNSFVNLGYQSWVSWDKEYSCGYRVSIHCDWETYFIQINAVRFGTQPVEAFNMGNITQDTVVDLRNVLCWNLQIRRLDRAVITPSDVENAVTLTFLDGEKYVCPADKNKVSAIEKNIEEIRVEIGASNSWLDQTELLSISTRREHSYVYYSDGLVAGAATSNPNSTYAVPVQGLDQILVFVGASDTVPASIAFYSSSTPDRYSYLKSASLQMVAATSKWYCAAVPSGAVTAVITNNESICPNPVAVGLSSSIYKMLKESNKTPWIDVEDILPLATRTPQRYTRYETGAISTSGQATLVEIYQVDVNGYDMISAFLASTDAVPASIAFYASDTPGESSYLKSSSVQMIAGKHWYSAIVPASAVCAVISNHYGTVQPPIILGNKATPFKELGKLRDSVNTLPAPIIQNPIKDGVLFHHLNVEAASIRTTIPSQSLMDIRYAKLLGFNFIEANVQKCSDDVLVVKHGGSGTLGAGVKLVGGGDCSDVLFSEVTSDWLRENVVYDSTMPKYCAPIPTLEEFCKECKALNMGVLLAGYGNTDAALAQIRQILSDQQIIAVAPSNRGDFKGFIDGWWQVDSVNDAIALVDRYGLPFILGWKNYASASQELINSVVAEMHKRGAFVGSTYLSAAGVLKAMEDGLDVIGATNPQVNPSLVGNLHNIRKLNDAALTFGAGASYDSSSDTVTMADGSTITLANTGHENDFVKLSITITHSGTIDILTGDSSSTSNSLYSVVGDGSKSIEYAVAIQRNSRILQLVAHGAVTIKDWTIITSVII